MLIELSHLHCHALMGGHLNQNDIELAPFEKAAFEVGLLVMSCFKGSFPHELEM